MKTTKQISMIMAVVLLSFSIYSCKKDTPRGLNYQIHKITLYVDTGSIDQQNLDSTCNFGQPPGVSNKDYLTNVHLGDAIIWEGVSSSSPNTDLVKIKKIKYDNGVKILNKDELEGETIVFGIVKNGKIKDEEKYVIKFTVFNKGIKRNGIFKIDPKLQIN